MMKTWWKRVAVAIFLLALSDLIWTSHVWYQYQATLPRHPGRVMGNIYPLNVHGIVVYQTRDQRDRLDRLDYSSFVLMIVAFVVGLVYTNKFGLPPTPPKPWVPGSGWQARSR